MPSYAAADFAGLAAILDSVVADWVRELDLRLLDAKPGEVVLLDADGRLAAHSTTTYALL